MKPYLAPLNPTTPPSSLRKQCIPLAAFIKTACMKAMTVAVLAMTATTANAQIATGNLLTNPGAETGDITGWTTSGVSKPYATSVLSIPSEDDNGFPPHSGDYFFRCPKGLSGRLSQTNLLAGRFGITRSQIDTGKLIANVGFFEISLDQDPPDSASVSLTFLNERGEFVSAAATPEVAALNLENPINPVFTNCHMSFSVPPGTRAIVYTINFIRHRGTELNSQVDDCSLTISGDGFADVAPPLAIRRAVEVSWASFTNRQYQVQWTTNAGDNWSNLGLPVSGTGTTNSVCDPLNNDDGNKLYRIISLP